MKSLVQIRDEISEAEWIGPDISTIDPVCYQDFESIFNVGFKHGYRIAQERTQGLVDALEFYENGQHIREYCFGQQVILEEEELERTTRKSYEALQKYKESVGE